MEASSKIVPMSSASCTVMRMGMPMSHVADGCRSEKANRITRTGMVIRKCTPLLMMVEKGNTKRGNRTFLIRPPFATKDGVAINTEF